MAREPVALRIAGVGASTRFGAGVAPLQEILRGRPAGFTRLREFLGSDFSPQTAAFSAPLHHTPQAAERIADLATSAFADLMSRGPIVQNGRGLAIAVLLPEACPEEALSEDTLRAVAAAVTERVCMEMGLSPDSASEHPAGAAALATALRDHREGLEEGRPLLILAADSYACRTRMMARLDAGLLFSGQSRYAPIPGEAGVALLVEPH
ncbi:MAG: hypothetical protein ACU0CI_02740, partial [Shimia sp.]